MLLKTKPQLEDSLEGSIRVKGSCIVTNIYYRGKTEIKNSNG